MLATITQRLYNVPYHTDVPETLAGVLVTIVDGEAVVILGAIVVGQLDNTFSISPVVVR